MTLSNGKPLTLKREACLLYRPPRTFCNDVTATSLRDHPGDFRRLVSQCTHVSIPQLSFQLRAAASSRERGVQCAGKTLLSRMYGYSRLVYHTLVATA
jgi:hypothetical protein